ncbi:hypothetical protein KHQ82_03500 [Mycoplasmatota bacterium]|nr:hypothetical protein KHQ82_03500 [Mycoplasmatota bacterium]
MAFNVLNYFISGNTAKGYHSLLKTNIEDVQLIVLLGNYQKLKTIIFKKIIERWKKNKHRVEVLHCASNTDYIDGVINRSINIGIIDGNRQELESLIIDDTFDVDDILDRKIKEKNIEDIIDYENDIINNHLSAYKHFSNALAIHDEWEEIYINNMNKERADQYTDEVIRLLLKEYTLDKSGKERHRFFGAATPEGPIDFIEDLTKDIGKRYFIKGRPGTGKSTLLKRLILNATNRGIDVEVYHCGFDPHSLDMVVLKDLDIVIFDSTAPHEYFPSRDKDEIIDMYAKIIKPGTDEKYADRLEEIIERYSSEVKLGTDFLKQSKELMKKKDNLYEHAVNKGNLNKFILQLNSKLDEYEK